MRCTLYKCLDVRVPSEYEEVYDIKTAATCTTCREDIRIGAKRCVHCDSFQDWRRHLNFSHTVLALLIALFSITTILIPILEGFLKQEISIVSLDFHGVHENMFSFIASNTGSKDGVIAEQILFLYGTDSKLKSFRLEPKFDQRISVAGKTSPFKTRLNPYDFEDFIKWLSNNSIQKAKVVVHIDNHNAPDYKKEFSVTNKEINNIKRIVKSEINKNNTTTGKTP